MICAGGYRSSVACSLLQRQGFAGELYNVVGGTVGLGRGRLPDRALLSPTSHPRVV